MSTKKQQTILLVEDETIIAIGEKKNLEIFGYKIIIANNGEEAINAVKKMPGIDLILMDINLGAGMDGTEAAAIILREFDIPVVFLSAYTEPEIVEKTEKITSYGYVVKNSSITVIDASIKMAFKLFKASATLKETAASYQVLFSGASDGIILADLQTKKFHYANPAICRMMGYNEEDFLKMGVADIHPKESLDYVLAEFAKLASGEIKYSYKIPCLRKDGTIFYADISHSTMTLAGREYNAGFFRDITERMRAESQKDDALAVLKESEISYRELFDNISSGVAIYDVKDNGKDFIFKDLNHAGERLDKTRKEDIIGKSIYQVRPGIEKFGLLEVFKRVYLTGIPEHYPVKFYQDEKLQGWYDNFVYRLPSGAIVAVFDNITERKQAEKKMEDALRDLRESEEKLQHIFNSIDDVIYSVDAKTEEFIFLSPAFERLFGYNLDDIKRMGGRKAFLSLIIQEDQFKNQQLAFNELNARERAESPRWVAWWRCKNGKLICIEDYSIPLFAGDSLLKTQGVLRDISERKLAEEEIERQLAEKVLLLKEVHHRIKNNIASISGLLALQMQTTTNPEVVAVLQEAISRVNSMRILYDKLLLSEGFKDVSVKNYLESLIDAIGELFPDKTKVTIEKHIVDFPLVAKKLFPLGIIINEILTNKMKYAFIDRDTGLIKISLANVANHVTLVIEDNGIGLPAGFDINESKGFGLKLVKMLSMQLAGSFVIDNHAGTVCKIEFDI